MFVRTGFRLGARRHPLRLFLPAVVVQALPTRPDVPGHDGQWFRSCVCLGSIGLIVQLSRAASVHESDPFRASVDAQEGVPVLPSGPETPTVFSLHGWSAGASGEGPESATSRYVVGGLRVFLDGIRSVRGGGRWVLDGAVCSRHCF